MIDLQWLLENADTAKDVIAEALSNETMEDIEAFKSLWKEGTDVTGEFYDKMEGITKKGLSILFDIAREPMQVAGYHVPEMRGVPSQETEFCKTKLERLQNAD